MRVSAVGIADIVTFDRHSAFMRFLADERMHSMSTLKRDRKCSLLASSTQFVKSVGELYAIESSRRPLASAMTGLINMKELFAHFRIFSAEIGPLRSSEVTSEMSIATNCDVSTGRMSGRRARMRTARKCVIPCKLMDCAVESSNRQLDLSTKERRSSWAGKMRGNAFEWSVSHSRERDRKFPSCSRPLRKHTSILGRPLTTIARKSSNGSVFKPVPNLVTDSKNALSCPFAKQG